MKTIMLSQNPKYKNSELNLFMLVDDEDYDYLMQWKWQIKKAGYTYYAQRTSKSENTHFKAHRVVMGITDPKIKIDHKDGDGLNNQKLNLRIATISQNTANRRKYKNSRSKYKGVYWNKEKGKWQVNITKDYKTKSIGRFTDEEEAALAYNKAAIEVHGEFAYLNIISK